ncbi:MAG: GIY-YIG nuclease family protein [Paludibacter sp.]
MIGCYIIHSSKLNRFYIGVTQDGVAARITKHNASTYGSHRFTSAADDWELFLFIPTADYAMRLESNAR